MPLSEQGYFGSSTGIVAWGAWIYSETFDCFNAVCYFQVSNTQFFGYTYFVPTLDVPTSVEIFVPTGTATTQTVSTTLTYTYLIGDDPNILSDKFVKSGFYVNFVQSSGPEPSLTIDQTAEVYAFDLEVDSDNILFIDDDIVVTVEVYDQRNPTGISSLDLTFKYRAACMATDFENAYFELDDHFDEEYFLS